jgi:hypothetical protein
LTVFEAFMDPDEAEEYLDYNVVGAWMGERTPAGADGAARIAAVPANYSWAHDIPHGLV